MYDVYPLPESLTNPLGNNVAVRLVGDAGALLIDKTGMFVPVTPFDSVAMVNHCPEHGPEQGAVLGIEFILLAQSGAVLPIDVEEFVVADKREGVSAAIERIESQLIEQLIGDDDPDTFPW